MKILKIATILVIMFMVVNPVFANSTGIDVDAGSDLGLQPITLPTFFDASQVANFSVFSYISIFLNLIFVVITIVWILLAVRAGFDWLRSEGSEDLIGQSKKRFGNVFISITFMFGFFVALILFSSFLGFGSFLNWPKQFSTCNDGGTYYFQLAIIAPGSSEEARERVCFEDGHLQCGSVSQDGYLDCYSDLLPVVDQSDLPLFDVEAQAERCAQQAVNCSIACSGPNQQACMSDCAREGEECAATVGCPNYSCFPNAD